MLPRMYPACCCLMLMLMLRGVSTAEERVYFSRGSLGDKKTSPRSDLFSMRPDGTDLKQLTNTDELEFDPTISQDGKFLAFSSVRMSKDEMVGRICVTNAEGEGRVCLSHENGYATNPAWSPDGQRLTYAAIRMIGLRSKIGLAPKSSIRVMNRDGSNDRDVGEGIIPQWSSDGKRIVHGKWPDKSITQYIIDLDDGNSRPFIEGGGFATWSPDGERIAYTGIGAESNIDLIVMNADGTNRLQLTKTEVAELGPRWSKDGKRIFFASLPIRDGKRRPLESEIYSVGIDGRGEKRLTNNDEADFLLGGSSLMEEFDFSSLFNRK